MSNKITKKPESFATLNEAELYQDCLDALQAMEQAQARFFTACAAFYASEKAAHEAVIKLRMEHLKYWQDELEKLEGNK